MGVTADQSALVLDHEVELDFGDLILFGIGEAIGQMRVLAGMDKPTVALGNGLRVVIEEQNPYEPCRNRLQRLQDAVLAVMDGSPEMNRDEVCRTILDADGWSWTVDTFRTPLWMVDHQELSRDEIAREFEVLEWLALSSSATR